MSVNPADDDATVTSTFAKALGARLRAVRLQQHLSLHGVEKKSGGRWKAVVVGSYERGDRAVSVQRLAELSEFYGVGLNELLPHELSGGSGSSGGSPLTRVVLNLERLNRLDDPQVELLQRFAQAIQRQRGDGGGRNLPLRFEDLRTLALMYDTTTEAITDRMVRLQVLSPESVIVDVDL